MKIKNSGLKSSIVILTLFFLWFFPVTTGLASYTGFVYSHVRDYEGSITNFSRMKNNDLGTYATFDPELVIPFPSVYRIDQTVAWDHIPNIYEQHILTMRVRSITSGVTITIKGEIGDTTPDNTIGTFSGTGTKTFDVSSLMITTGGFNLQFYAQVSVIAFSFDISILRIDSYDLTDPTITVTKEPAYTRISNIKENAGGFSPDNNQFKFSFADDEGLYRYYWEFNDPTPDTVGGHSVDLSGGTFQAITFDETTITGLTSDFYSLPDGPQTLYLRVLDIDSNDATYSFAFEKDSTPPSTPVVSTANHIEGVWSEDNDPIFYYSSSDGYYGSGGIAGYSYTINVAPDDNIDTTSTSVLYTNLPDAIWTFNIVAFDKAHPVGKSNVGSFSVSIDTMFQIGSFPEIADIYGSWSNDNTPTFQWSTCFDSASGLNGYYWAIGSNQPKIDGTFTTETSTTVSPQADGANSFYVIAEDNMNHLSMLEVVSFYIDTTAPDSPEPDDNIEGWTQDTVLTFNWTEIQDDSDVLGYWYAIDDPNPEVTGTFTTETEVTLIDLEEGNHTIYVCAENEVGLISEVGTHEFYIDTTSPTSPSPDDGVGEPSYDDTPTFTWLEITDISGVGYWYAVDNPNPESGGTWTTTTSITLPSQSEGSHIFYIKAMNGVGLLSSVASHSFTITTIPTTTETTTTESQTTEMSTTEPSSTSDSSTTENPSTESSIQTTIVTSDESSSSPLSLETPSISLYLLIPFISIYVIFRRKRTS